jgi:glycosyltransferase involved in cell wall biosynthesis
MALNVLQLCHKPPFPSIDGGCLEMAKMSTFFDQNEDYNLQMLCFHTTKHPYLKKSFNVSLKNTIHNSIFVDVKPNALGALFNLLKGKSYNLSRFESENFKSKLIDLLKENTFNIIQLESIFVAKYISIIKKYSDAKIVLNSPNVEYEIWDRLAKETKSLIKRFYLSVLTKQLAKEEKQFYREVDAIIAITNKDERTYNKEVPHKKTITAPFALSLNNYVVKDKEIENVSFFHIGSMNWKPNIAGVSWFIDNVWKTNFINNKEISFNIAGIDMPTNFFNYSISNFQVQGFVEDAKKFICNHDVMVVPLFSGSGLRIKIIEAMALGKCVISTSIGAEGIDYKDGENILIANSDKEFKENIESLACDISRVKRIGDAARVLVEKNYDRLALNIKIDKFYKSLYE